MPTRSPASRAGAPLRGRAAVLAAATLVCGMLLLALAPPSPAQEHVGEHAQEPAGALVDVVEAAGILDDQVADYLVGVISDAGAGGAEVVVVQLDLRGALGGSAERVARAIRSSDVPVVTWVGPPGARVAGGGLLVAQAGHVRAAAPATMLGPGVPVDLTDPGRDDVRSRYSELGQAGGRLPELLAGGAVAIAPTGGDRTLPDGVELPPGVERSDVSVVDEREAVETGLLDLTAVSLPELLPALGGRQVALASGPVALDVDVTANPRFNNLGLVRQVLHAVAHPALAYLLLVGGALALSFELFQPGFGVAGLSGIATAALGVYGLTVLPTRWLALAAVLAGLLLLAADLAIGRLGVLTASGTVAFAVGSWLLLPGPAPLQVPLWVVAVITVGAVVFFVGVMTTVLRAQGNQALSGADQVLGEAGVVRSMLNPEGHVFVGGALWRARAPDDAGKVKAGTRVRVLGLGDKLTLDVVPIVEDGEETAAEPASPSGTS
jgi:membrane-bound serine protease (ClpP class)